MLASHIAEESAALLDRFPTTAEEDDRLLNDLHCQRRMSNGAASAPHQQTEVHMGMSSRSRGAEEQNESWFALQHALLSICFRRERKRLLWRVRDDLLCQASFCVFYRPSDQIPERRQLSVPQNM